MSPFPFVIPGLTRNPVPSWIPAFAGMTECAESNVAEYNIANASVPDFAGEIRGPQAKNHKRFSSYLKPALKSESPS